MNLLAFSMLLVCGAAALAQSPETKLMDGALQAMGGKDQVLSIRTMEVYGYGQLAYMNGGGNISPLPQAPQKWQNVNASHRTIDLEHGRMRLQQHRLTDFVFANSPMMTTGAVIDVFLDGDVAYNLAGANPQPVRAADEAARARRVDMLLTPLSMIRAAMDPKAKLTNARKEGTQDVMDLTTAKGDRITVAFDGRSHLPAWVGWVVPDANLGELNMRTYFTGYQNEHGVMLPSGYNTIQDFRNISNSKLYVDKYVLNGSISDLAAPAAVVAAKPPVPQPEVNVTAVSKGVWFLKGRGGANVILFEFADHLTLFEVPSSEIWTQAIIAKARATVPGKPITEAIVSHHHFDHTGGVRAAVAEGITLIAQRDNEVIFKEMTTHAAKVYPDALAKNMQALKFKAVDETLTLKDSTMEVVVYRAISNSHMANSVFAYIPRDKIVVQGDLVDEGWDWNFWANSYPDSVKFWKLDVVKDLPVHGNIHTYAEVLDQLRGQIKRSQELCDRSAKDGFALQGCPVSNTF